jgi:hypothetical protein
MTQGELLRRINLLRRTDNYRSWLYLVREYLFLGLTVGLMVASITGSSSRN